MCNSAASDEPLIISEDRREPFCHAYTDKLFGTFFFVMI